MDPTIKDFEAAIAELESVVKQLEAGDLALETSLALYERGVQLSRFCHARLDAAERRIEILNERGELTRGAARPRRREPGRGSVMTPFEAFATECRGAVDEALDRWLPRPPRCPAVVAEAMRYSVMAGGKRLRPILALAAADAVAAARGESRPAARTLALPAACALETDPHLLAHPRRPAGDGRRLPAPRAADAARGQRRRHGHPRRRRAAGRSVRAAGPRACRRAARRPQAARARAGRGCRRARRHGRRTGHRPVRRRAHAGSGQHARRHGARPTCTRARPGR